MLFLRHFCYTHIHVCHSSQHTHSQGTSTAWKVLCFTQAHAALHTLHSLGPLSSCPSGAAAWKFIWKQPVPRTATIAIQTWRQGDHSSSFWATEPTHTEVGEQWMFFVMIYAVGRLNNVLLFPTAQPLTPQSPEAAELSARTGKFQ